MYPALYTLHGIEFTDCGQSFVTQYCGSGGVIGE
jgi:hypothetical protein